MSTAITVKSSAVSMPVWNGEVFAALRAEGGKKARKTINDTFAAIGKQGERTLVSAAYATRLAIVLGDMADGPKKKTDPERMLTQDAYAEAHEVSKTQVTQWKRLGYFLTEIEGADDTSDLWKKLGAGGWILVPAVATEVTRKGATLASIQAVVDQNTDKDGKKVTAKKAAQPASSNEDGATIKAADGKAVGKGNIVNVLSGLSAQFVKNWKEWDLNAEDTAHVVSHLEGMLALAKGEEVPSVAKVTSRRAAKEQEKASA